MIAQATLAVRLAAATVTTRAGLRASMAAMRGSTESGLALARRTSEVMPMTSRRRKYRSLMREIRPIRSLPPLEFWSGVSPSDAANCRPERNRPGSVTDATRAVAEIKLTPGIVPRRCDSSLDRCQVSNSYSNAASRTCTSPICPASPVITRTASSGTSGRIALRDSLRQLDRVMQPAYDLDAELGEQAADHVHELGALLDQQIARPVQCQCRLLFRRLYRDEPHRRAGHCLANRFRVIRVRLAALNIRLHVSRGHQPNLMSEFGQLACPMVGGAARFDADQARRQLCKERQHL